MRHMSHHKQLRIWASLTRSELSSTRTFSSSGKSSLMERSISASRLRSATSR